ncbi:DUF1778 domain-containing protein [Nocardia sp. NPDC050630]|uniref:DUF1778 domain-containing protein n=1 Tax=Nocardia sp. NPDC050630 TaxID=3364321 RepID=UPI003799187F
MAVRDDRLQVRVGAIAKRRLEEAAETVHLSLSAFILQAAQRVADSILADRDSIKLSPAAAAAVQDALSRPAQVNERLAVALGRPTKFRWLD